MTPIDRRKLTKKHPRKHISQRAARNKGLQLLPHLTKHLFQYMQAGSRKGGRSMSNTISRVDPIQRMKQSAMLVVLNVTY
jgi:hypothetical protein